MSNQTKAQGYEGVILRVIVIVVVLAIGAYAVYSMGNAFANFGPPPPGVVDGQLDMCGSSNCLSSAEASSDAQYITPIELAVSAEQAMAALEDAIRQLPNDDLRAQDDTYLFVRIGSIWDNGAVDVELFINEADNQIELRLSPRASGTDIDYLREQADRLRTQYLQEIE